MRLLVMEMVNYGWEPVRWVYVLTDVGIIKWQVIPCHWHMRIYSIFIVMIKNRMWIGTFGGRLNLAVSQKTGMFFFVSS